MEGSDTKPMPTLAATDKPYAEAVNPQWVRLLDVLQMNVPFAHCRGTELWRTDRRRVLDFLSGYCVHNTGHNHPRIIQALKKELERNGPVMLQSNVPELAGELGARLCARAGGRLKKAHFTNSGSEGVEAAIKFARAHTGRGGMLFAEGAFHGLTCGALSLMGSGFWREGFGSLLPGPRQVPFGDLTHLEAELSTGGHAAFIVEPIQGEGGIRIPDPEYLLKAQALCRRYGSLFILDEVQTGMYRTGRFLAGQHFGLDPDVVILAKALSGGLVPVGAALITDDIYKSVYTSLKRAIIHTSTFSENSLAMRAGLATLDVLESEQLGERALTLGAYMRQRLQETLSKYEMVKAVRGLGLFCGVEFQAPRRLSLGAAFEAFRQIHPGMFGQMLVMRLFRDKDILTQICGNNFLVLKATPPLNVENEQVEEFAVRLGEVMELLHTSSTFWSEALGLARRVVSI
jgi:ornithine--oxo-acid transaminase